MSTETKNRLYELKVQFENSEKTYSLNDADESAENAFAYGANAIAQHSNSTAFGNNTITNAANQTVIGSFNATEDTTKYLFVIGNGTDRNNRSNALTVDSKGNAQFAGEVTATTIMAPDKVQTNEIAIGNIALQESDNGHLVVKQLADDNIDNLVYASEIYKEILTLSKINGHKLNVTIHNRNSNKNYTVRLLARSRYRGSKTGEWYEVNAEHGYVKLANKEKSVLIDNNIKRTFTYPDMPAWMPKITNSENKEVATLVNSWRLPNNSNSIQIDCATWLVPMCKPLSIIDANGTITLPLPSFFNDTDNTEAADYVFTEDTPPPLAGLIGLSSTSGYRGLDFKFRLYDSDGTAICDSEEYISISGNARKDIIKGLAKPPSSSYVTLTTDENEETKISNIHLRIK